MGSAYPPFCYLVESSGKRRKGEVMGAALIWITLMDREAVYAAG